MNNKIVMALIGLICLQTATIQSVRRPPVELGQELIEVIRTERNPGKAQKLIAAGADLNARDAMSGKTPLHWAIHNDDNIITLALIKAGATINAQDTTNNTPLHDAVITDNADAVKALIAAGANIHLKNKSGFSPLELAHEFENQDILNAFNEE